MSRTLGHLVNATGVAKILGVSRQRVHQLIDSDPTFPNAITVLGRTRVWEQPVIESWAIGAGRVCKMHRRPTTHEVTAHGRLVGYCDECVSYNVVKLGFVPGEPKKSK